MFTYKTDSCWLVITFTRIQCSRVICTSGVTVESTSNTHWILFFFSLPFFFPAKYKVNTSTTIKLTRVWMRFERTCSKVGRCCDAKPKLNRTNQIVAISCINNVVSFSVNCYFQCSTQSGMNVFAMLYRPSDLQRSEYSSHESHSHSDHSTTTCKCYVP